MGIETLKKQIVQAGQNIAVLKSNLDRYLEDLKERFGMNNINAAKLDGYLKLLDKKIKRFKKREALLYSKAELIMEDIDNVP